MLHSLRLASTSYNRIHEEMDRPRRRVDLIDMAHATHQGVRRLRLSKEVMWPLFFVRIKMCIPLCVTRRSVVRLLDLAELHRSGSVDADAALDAASRTPVPR